MEKVRPSFLLSLITVTGLILSAWLILYGLQLRFFGAFVTPQGILRILTPPEMLIRWLMGVGIEANLGELGWPLVVIGCSLVGSLGGVWMRQSWAIPSITIFSFASIITFHWINLLSLLLLLFARSPTVRVWLTADHASAG